MPKNEFVQLLEQDDVMGTTLIDMEEICSRVPSELEQNSAFEATILLQGQFDILVTSAVRRQDSALDLVERYQSLKQKLNPVKEILEGEYQEIESPPTQAVAQLGHTQEASDDIEPQNSSQLAQQPQK